MGATSVVGFLDAASTVGAMGNPNPVQLGDGSGGEGAAPAMELGFEAKMELGFRAKMELGFGGTISQGCGVCTELGFGGASLLGFGNLTLQESPNFAELQRIAFKVVGSWTLNRCHTQHPEDCVDLTDEERTKNLKLLPHLAIFNTRLQEFVGSTVEFTAFRLPQVDVVAFPPRRRACRGLAIVQWFDAHMELLQKSRV